MKVKVNCQHVPFLLLIFYSFYSVDLFFPRWHTVWKLEARNVQALSKVHGNEKTRRPEQNSINEAFTNNRRTSTQEREHEPLNHKHGNTAT